MHYTYPNGDEVYLVSVVYFCKGYIGEIILDKSEVSEACWFDVNCLPQETMSPVETTSRTWEHSLQGRSRLGAICYTSLLYILLLQTNNHSRSRGSI